LKTANRIELTIETSYGNNDLFSKIKMAKKVMLMIANKLINSNKTILKKEDYLRKIT
jgi:hypothetical protein